MLGLAMLLLIGGLTALALTSLTMARRLTHPPRKTYAWAVSRSRPGTPSELPEPRPFEPRLLRAGGAEFPAWWIPGDQPRGPLVIFTPGWGDSRLGVLPRLAPLLPHASAVLAWDPPGLGEAGGLCALGAREPRLLAEIVERETDADPSLQVRGVVLFGSSLGAGVSIVTAAGGPPAPAADAAFGARLNQHAAASLRAVIAEAPYRHPHTPAHNVMELSGLPHRLNGPVAFALLAPLLAGAGSLSRSVFGWGGFDRVLHARRLACPLLVLHPGMDEVSPVDDGETIARAAPNGRFVRVENAGHNTMWTDDATRPEAARAVAAFLEELAASPPQGYTPAPPNAPRPNPCETSQGRPSGA